MIGICIGRIVGRKVFVWNWLLVDNFWGVREYWNEVYVFSIEDLKYKTHKIMSFLYKSDKNLKIASYYNSLF